MTWNVMDVQYVITQIAIRYSLLHTFIHDSYGHNEATAMSRGCYLKLRPWAVDVT